jgi:hypothetical protein
MARVGQILSTGVVVPPLSQLSEGARTLEEGAHLLAGTSSELESPLDILQETWHPALVVYLGERQ